jgi:ribonuclease HI
MVMEDREKPPERWVRMRFRQGKVWAAADADGRPVERDGLTPIKYRLDQGRIYRVRRSGLAPLDAPSPAPAPAPAGPAPRRRAAGQAACIHVYTDGASRGNPGPAGIGVVLQHGGERREISAPIGETTNNIAELMAIAAGLAAVADKRLPVKLYTDSSYAHGVLCLDWKPKKNLELIAAVRAAMAEFRDLEIIKVPGHRGVAANERADQLATAAARGGK